MRCRCVLVHRGCRLGAAVAKVLLKFRVVTVCSHKEHLNVVPPFIDFVV